jgi:SnoaL-like domain
MSAATIERFYSAFARLDHATMQACYSEGATFRDEAFSLAGPAQIGGMWRMLCEATKAKGLAHWKLEHSQVQSNGKTGSAHWDAHYLFSATGRKVLNRIDAKFVFDERGLIVEHVDSFNFHTWARQALGLPGLLLGWTPFLRKKVQERAATQLQRYLAGKG